MTTERLIIIADVLVQGPPQSFHVQLGNSVRLFPYSTNRRVRVDCLARPGLWTEKFEVKSLRSIMIEQEEDRDFQTSLVKGDIPY